MKNIHPKNERSKWNYFRHRREALGKSEATIDSVRMALDRFERYTGFKDFASFHREQAIGFKRHLLEAGGGKGKALSRATILTTLSALKAFFRWLSFQSGYKSRIHVPDIEYFNLSDKEKRGAKAPRFKAFPTLEQIRTVVHSMPATTEIEQRNRALIAFTILTGIRDRALASLSLKHVDLTGATPLVIQHPSEVVTKFGKRIDTYFFPVGDDLKQIVLDWITFLKAEKLFGVGDPLFPRTRLGHDANNGFVADGLEPVHWSTAAPIRKIFREAFEAAGLEYFSPHLFRNTLAHLGEQCCTTPEEFKAWSQNLGHESTLTTFNSYGTLSTHRQGELIRQIGSGEQQEDKLDQVLQAVRSLGGGSVIYRSKDQGYRSVHQRPQR